MSKQLRALGNQGEALVCAELEKNGFIILERNYTSRQGEVDIIARKHTTIVFVEVKLRQQPQFALSDVINKTKQRKIIKTALYYISQHKFSSTSMYRFDVALIQNCQITYIENAFTVPE